MGWLRKKGRQLDKRIRKIFGKNAWLKVAMLVGAGYVGMTGAGAGGAGATSLSSFAGNIGKFGSNVLSGAKDFFWNKGPTDAVTNEVAKGSLSWAGQTAANVGVNVLTGIAQQSMEPLYGQQAGFAPQENSAVNKAVMASNAAYGANGSILDAYRNFDFGPASTTMLVESARNRNISRNYIS